MDSTSPDGAPAAPGSAAGSAAGSAGVAASQVHAAVTQVLRWASRGDVRRELLGSEASDLSPTDSWLLAAIDARGPVRATELAAWQGVDKSTMALQVRRLEDRGLVARRPDPVDRRAVLLTLTPRGAEIHARTVTAGTAVVDHVLAAWEPADREALAVLLGRFAQGLERPGRRA